MAMCEDSCTQVSLALQTGETDLEIEKLQVM